MAGLSQQAACDLQSWSHDRKVAALTARLGAKAVAQALDGEAMHKRGGAIQAIGNM